MEKKQTLRIYCQMLKVPLKLFNIFTDLNANVTSFAYKMAHVKEEEKKNWEETCREKEMP